MMLEIVAEYAAAISTWQAVPGLALAALIIAIGIAILVDAVSRP
jgi:hypothetical protein